MTGRQAGRAPSARDVADAYALDRSLRCTLARGARTGCVGCTPSSRWVGMGNVCLVVGWPG